jgi:hypothetical protein
MILSEFGYLKSGKLGKVFLKSAGRANRRDSIGAAAKTIWPKRAYKKSQLFSHPRNNAEVITMDLKAGLGLAIIATSSPGVLAAKGGLHVHPSQVVAGLLIATVLLLGLVILFGPRGDSTRENSLRDKSPRASTLRASTLRGNNPPAPVERGHAEGITEGISKDVTTGQEREPLNRA